MWEYFPHFDQAAEEDHFIFALHLLLQFNSPTVHVTIRDQHQQTSSLWNLPRLWRDRPIKGGTGHNDLHLNYISNVTGKLCVSKRDSSIIGWKQWQMITYGFFAWRCIICSTTHHQWPCLSLRFLKEMLRLQKPSLASQLFRSYGFLQKVKANTHKCMLYMNEHIDNIWYNIQYNRPVSQALKFGTTDQSPSVHQRTTRVATNLWDLLIIQGHRMIPRNWTPSRPSLGRSVTTFLFQLFDPPTSLLHDRSANPSSEWMSAWMAQLLHLPLISRLKCNNQKHTPHLRD